MMAMSWGTVTGLPMMLIGLPILMNLPLGMPTAIRYIRMVTGF